MKKRTKKHRALDKARASSKHQKEIAVVAKVVKATESNLDARITEKWKAGATIGQLASEYSKKRSDTGKYCGAVGGRDEFRCCRPGLCNFF